MKELPLPPVRPEWRTDTVVALCLSMREAQDFSALPILADALQDADCASEELLTRLRARCDYAESAALVACVLSERTEEAARWLVDFPKGHDCPWFPELFNAATGNHHLNDLGDGYNFSRIGDWDDSYLHFNGSDAHGEIPDVFWEKVELVSGKTITQRPSQFSCSC